MRSWFIWSAAAGVVAVAALGACGGDDVAVSPPDAGHSDAAMGVDASGGSPDGGADAGSVEDASDAAHDARTGDASPDGGAGGPFLLMSYNASASSELVAFDVGAKKVAGRLEYPGFIGSAFTDAPDPYLLEQATDLVAKLDRARPWEVRSSWSVRMNDRPDGAADYADPQAVIVGAGTKAYVLRYTRNEIAVIDTSQTADAGAPIGTIDLSDFVQPTDTDGRVEMTAGVYVPSKRLVYVLLGNVDINQITPAGMALCANTHPAVVAIDVDSDQVVKLTGGDPNGALLLGGYEPAFGLPLAYDSALDRLVVLEDGCNGPADGGAGPIQQRIVEELSLFTGRARTLLDANAMPFPTNFAYIDQHRALVSFSDFVTQATFLWDPSEPSLGATVPDAPDAWVYDGQGDLLGVANSGVSLDVVSLRIADGQRTVLGSNPFTLSGGFGGGVALWPPR